MHNPNLSAFVRHLEDVDHVVNYTAANQCVLPCAMNVVDGGGDWPVLPQCSPIAFAGLAAASFGLLTGLGKDTDIEDRLVEGGIGVYRPSPGYNDEAEQCPPETINQAARSAQSAAQAGRAGQAVQSPVCKAPDWVPNHGSGKATCAAIAHDVSGQCMPCAATHSPAPGKPVRRHKPPEFQRLITGVACLRLLYVPRDMHACLGLGAAHPKQTSGSRSSACTVQLTMARGVSVPVTLTGKVVRGACYRRFTKGWRAFCETAGVQVGDTLIFSRLDRVGEVSVTHVSRRVGHPRSAGAIPSLCPQPE